MPASAADESDVQAATGQVVEFDTGTDGYVLAQPAEAGSPLVRGRSRRPRAVGVDHAAAAGRRRRAGRVDRRASCSPRGQRSAAADRATPAVCSPCRANPVKVVRWCDGEVDAQDDLVGVDGRGVVAAVAAGERLGVGQRPEHRRSRRCVGPEGDIERLDDWGAAFGQRRAAERAAGGVGERARLASTTARRSSIDDELPELDEDDENERPIARGRRGYAPVSISRWWWRRWRTTPIPTVT